MSENMLTPYEKQLVANAEILLAKSRIILKVVNMFASLAQEYVTLFSKNTCEEVLAISPKISKGEQYLGLPYVVLDYPRFFAKHDTLAIRTLFWWGKHFSLHLIICGKYKVLFQNAVRLQIEKGYFDGWYICINDNEWQHHFEADNYASLNADLSPEILERRFLKIAKKIPLSEWNNVSDILLDDFKKLLGVLNL